MSVACGLPSEEPTETVSDLQSYDEFVGAFDSRFCQLAERCQIIGRATSCRKLFSLTENSFFLQSRAGIVAGRSRFDGTGLQPLLDSMAAPRCEFVGQQELRRIVTAFEGNVEEGGECWSDTDCAGNALCNSEACDRESTCCAGACIGFNINVPPGASCNRDQCNAESSCQGTNGDPVDICVPNVPAGEPCDLTQDCAGDNGCRPDQTGTLRCLTRRPGEGETCESTCGRRDNWCDGASQRCEPVIRVGGACGESGDDCAELAECIDGSCVALLLAGESCEPGGAIGCRNFQDCDLVSLRCPPEPQAEICP